MITPYLVHIGYALMLCALLARDGAAGELPVGYFVAEMSLLTGRPANADVDAVGEVEAMRWALADLAPLRRRNPLLWTKIQSVIGHDIVEKIQRAENRPAS